MFVFTSKIPLAYRILALWVEGVGNLHLRCLLSLNCSIQGMMFQMDKGGAVASRDMCVGTGWSMDHPQNLTGWSMGGPNQDFSRFPV